MLRQALDGVTRNGTAAHPARQVTAVNRRGRTVELQIAASPMRTGDGRVSGIILVIDQRSP